MFDLHENLVKRAALRPDILNQPRFCSEENFLDRPVAYLTAQPACQIGIDALHKAAASGEKRYGRRSDISDHQPFGLLQKLV